MLTQRTAISTTKVAQTLACSVAIAALMSLVPNASRAAPIGGIIASGNATISSERPGYDRHPVHRPSHHRLAEFQPGAE